MKIKILSLFLVLLSLAASAQIHDFATANNVTWNSPGTNENDSMPLGNGDIALNVWTEQNGDIVLLVAKSDAWSENAQLLKLGRVRVSLDPSPFARSSGFVQTLKLDSGEVEIRSDKGSARIWVDANHPVARVEVDANKPLQMTAKSEVWRTKSYHLNQQAVQRAGFFEWGNNPDGLTFDPDTILPAQKDRITWCHFNSRSIYPLVFQKENLESLLPKYPDPLLHRCFGVTMKGEGLVSDGNQALKSKRASKSIRLDLHALTQQADSPEAWQAALNKVVKATDAVKIKKAYAAHEQWWKNFWNRSWVRVGGAPDAEKVSQSYAIQRYMTACAGRGAQPIKFNGSLFNVGRDLPEGTSSTPENHDPDFRQWGACFWNQNQRHIYWPLIATGDHDMIAPWFNMYVQALPLARDRTRLYFKHDGGAFIETIYFWGLPNVNDFGWNNRGPELQSEWIRHYVQGAMEMLAQMLDYYDYTQDAGFARNSLLPLVDATITFYDQHWKRGDDGKIHMTPAQSIEIYQKDAVNPTPDIAGLMSILPRLLSLPSNLYSSSQRDLWAKVLKDLPPLPIGTTAKGKIPPRGQGEPDGKRIILPAQKYGEPKNHENPELYAVFPYPIYGVGKPDLEMARDTFKARIYPFGRCWGQDGIHAASLGLTEQARNVVIEEFTSYGGQQFRWFWSKNSDWIPDMDNGGAGMMTLQLMLMKCDGKRIQLLPAWPANWTADFKLHAPYQTTVEGHVENGKVTGLKVTPVSRSKDVVILTAE